MMQQADPNDEYWNAVRFVRDQIQGLNDGVNAGLAGTGRPGVTFSETLLHVTQLDMDDIKLAINASHRIPFESWSTDAVTEWTREHTHCSAAIKFTADGGDIFVGHNT